MADRKDALHDQATGCTRRLVEIGLPAARFYEAREIVAAWIDNYDDRFLYGEWPDSRLQAYTKSDERLMMKISIPALAKWLVAFVIAEWISLPGSMRTLVIFMAIDYASGLAVGFMRKELSSAIGLRGLVRKGMVLLLLLTVHIAEQNAGADLRLEHIGALGYMVNEIISIIENCARAGVPIPAQLVSALMSMQNLRGRPATGDELKAFEKSAGV
jgi:toxin secretion/phage lysis holin